MVKNDFIRTVAQVLGGAFFLFGLFFTWKNLLIAQDKQTTDLFTKAIEQLGSDKLEVRLGGIYALERIARDSVKDHWPIMEVLTAYVREYAPWPPENLLVAQKKRPWAKYKVTYPPDEGKIEGKEENDIKPDPDIQAVLTVLGRRIIPPRPKGEKFPHLDLRRTNLAGARLRHANLQKANLWGANLQKAILHNADLQGASLSEANLQKAKLGRADLQGVNLREAKLQGAAFSEYNSKGNLLEAKGLTYEQVAEAFPDKTTKWPESLAGLRDSL